MWRNPLKVPRRGRRPSTGSERDRERGVGCPSWSPPARSGHRRPAGADDAGGLLLGHVAAVATASRPNLATQTTEQAVDDQLLGWLAVRLGRAHVTGRSCRVWLRR
jgi:hypothetical protein